MTKGHIHTHTLWQQLKKLGVHRSRESWPASDANLIRQPDDWSIVLALKFFDAVDFPFSATTVEKPSVALIVAFPT